MINYNTLGKHSKYSRYSSQKIPTNPSTWTYSIDPALWPVIPPNNFRVMSLNCERFPKTYYSKIIIANLILSSKPDIVILQEVSGFAMIRNLVQFINSYHGSYLYDVRFGYESTRNLSLVTIYNINSLSLLSQDTLYETCPAALDCFRRLPLEIKFHRPDFDVLICNNHFVSHSHSCSVEMINNSFEFLGNYFNWSPSMQLVLLGGDFNTSTGNVLYSTYLSQFNLNYGPYYNNSDLIMFHLDNLGTIIRSGFKQYHWNFNLYCNVSNTDYGLYCSDHKPIVLDMPL